MTLPPVGSAFVLTGVGEPAEAPALEPVETITLDGDWEFEAEDPNALVLDRWEAAVDGTDDWVEMLAGAWAYQLPAEPTRPYPLPVRYRATFEVGAVPPRAELIIDGFAGEDWEAHVNAQKVSGQPERSPFDAQMRTLPIERLLQVGENVLEIGITVTGPTDGLLDLLKIIGDFSLEGRCIVQPRGRLAPAPWTEQGYPFYSGLGVYRFAFELAEGDGDERILLEPELADDAVEVVVNGAPVGVRLWPPYGLEITEHVHAGENTLELRVANTLVNLLDGVERRSGLAGPPKLVRCR